MTPDPEPSPEQQAVELEAAASIADDHGNHLFAKEMRELAAEIRLAAAQPE